MYKWISVSLFILAVLNTMLITFAFRDMSWMLICQFLFTLISLPTATLLLLHETKGNKMFWFSPMNQDSGKVRHIWIEEDEENEEFNLEGRFCINNE